MPKSTKRPSTSSPKTRAGKPADARGENPQTNGHAGDEAFRRQLGANVSRLREAKGLKPTELAAAVGVERIRISRIEKGEHAPGAARLLRLAKALDTTAEALAE